MKDYIYSIHETSKLILSGIIGSTEIERFSKSDTRWAKQRRKGPTKKKSFKKGEVYQIDFGKNLIPEMSYEHRGLVIGANKQMLYVLPIFTYRPENQNDVYHPDNNPKGSCYFLKASDYSFIKHDSLLKLNDLRSVSTRRVIYEHKEGGISPQSDEFKLILELVISKIFPSFMHELNQLRNPKQ